MDRIEEALKEGKRRYDHLQVPDEMEGRLRQALDRGKGRKKPFPRMAIAAALILILFFTYHFDALAYYGKMILGYDMVMSQTLRDLNELGKGQGIGKTHTFSNGVELTLDGVMVDDNQLLAFYRIQGWDKSMEDESFLSNIEFKGLLHHYDPSSGQGEFNEANNETVWIHSFEPPKFFEKKLTFQGSLKVHDHMEAFSISFPLDRSKAMGHHIKQKINRRMKLEKQEVHFDSILATKTQTVIQGSLASSMDLALEQITGEQVRPGIAFDLVANGKRLEAHTGSSSTSLKGIHFEHGFDALPEDLKDLQVQITGITMDKRLEEIISIREGMELEVEGQGIHIQSIRSQEGQTEITIETLESVLLPGIELLADGEVIPLKTTHSEEVHKTSHGILKRRIILFEGTGEELQLKLNHIHYIQEFNETLEIPI